jgi:alkylation response protein AidB-like acyl-CoA dehydrogenase
LIDFTFTEEQDLFREAIREWLAKNLPIERVRANDTNHSLGKDLIRGLGDLGLLCMTLPEDHGGAGADWVTATIAAEEQTSRSLSQSSSLSRRAGVLWWTSIVRRSSGISASGKRLEERDSSESASLSQAEAQTWLVSRPPSTKAKANGLLTARRLTSAVHTSARRWEADTLSQDITIDLKGIGA